MAAAGMDVMRVVSVMLLCLISSSHGYEFFVGGQDGWVVKPHESYDHWASRNRFQVQDTLVFKYKKEAESVLEVEKEHYLKCDTSNPLKTFSDGDSKVKLTRSGPFYFISGRKSSCESGQKLHIVVISERSTPSAPGPLAPTPSPPTPHPTVSPVSPTPISPSPFSPSWTPTPESPKAQPPSPQISPSPSPTPVVSPPKPSNSPSPSPTPSNSSSPSPSPTPTASPPEPSTPPSPSPTASPPAPPSNATSPSPSPESDSPAPSPAKSSAYAITSSTVMAFGISLFISVTLGLF